MTNHTCNAYCGPDGHCDVYHASPNITADGLWQSLGYYRGLKVIHAEPAREAGPRPEDGDLIAGNPQDATQPWLVWWR